MRKFIAVLTILSVTLVVFAACAVEPVAAREQVNSTDISSVRQDAYGNIYVEVEGSGDVSSIVSVGYALGDAVPVNWQAYYKDTPIAYFDTISPNVGDTINFFTMLNEYTEAGVKYNQSAPSEAYSYRVKDIYDADSEWYRSKTTFMDTCSPDGELLRDIAQSGVYDSVVIDSWDYIRDDAVAFFDNVYYLNNAGLSIILKSLTVSKNGENYNYILLDPDITYEYALSKSSNPRGNEVWHTYIPLIGIIFEDADWIFFRISSNEDYCESIAFMTLDVQGMTRGND